MTNEEKNQERLNDLNEAIGLIEGLILQKPSNHSLHFALLTLQLRKNQVQKKLRGATPL